MLALKIRHIRDALLREFSDHIEMSDVEKRSAPEREQVYLSRALTAFAIQDITGCTTADAAAGVIDGRDDHGIDGVAVNSGGAPHVWLVQTKWSDRAKAGLDLSAVLKLERGLTKLVNGEYDHFNSRFQKIAGEVDEALATPGVRITLVIALMGQSELAPEITAELDTICAKMNDGDEPMLDVVVRTLADFHRFVRDGLADPAIELEAHIEDVGQLADPYRAYYGTMPVAEVARWYSEHGERLFAKNIRRSLGVTEVNRDLMRTLREKPEHFWYFNNGITVLCDSVRRTARYATGEFHLTGASVVNGAQTVKSISEATREAPEALARGRVWVRFISLEHCPEGFASAVTKATNTQNRVEARDFVALDPDQARLRDEFALSLHKTYVVKRGEVDPAPDAGCSVVEAARALACAHRNPGWAARAKRDSSLLWERGEQGAYQALFGGKPSAFRVWRTVQALREVSARLRARQTALEGRAAQIVQQANLLTTHVVLQLLSSRAMDEPDGGWDDELERIPELTDAVIERMSYEVNATFGSSSHVLTVFTKPERCRVLASRVLEGITKGTSMPELPEDYRPLTKESNERRANAVPTLIDAGRLADGTALEFRAGTKPERLQLSAWLAADPRRAQATWSNTRGKPLIWAVDGKSYSPTRLVKHMILLATGSEPKSIPGPSRWHVPGEGSLWELALEVMKAEAP